MGKGFKFLFHEVKNDFPTLHQACNIIFNMKTSLDNSLWLPPWGKILKFLFHKIKYDSRTLHQASKTTTFLIERLYYITLYGYTSVRT